MQKEVVDAIDIEMNATIDLRACIKSEIKPRERLPTIAPTSNMLVSKAT